MNENIILTPIAPGELVDKITVLEIKKERLTDPLKLANVNTELSLLLRAKGDHMANSEKLDELEKALKEANIVIWDMSEKIREHMSAKNYDDEFIKVSYEIHSANDKRAAIKKEINLMLGSSLIEEKSYKH